MLVALLVGSLRASWGSSNKVSCQVANFHMSPSEPALQEDA